MRNKLEMDQLLDFYGVLLTEKQQEVCSYYCREDYSLQEIADIAGISRSGVHDMIRRCRKEMEKYEEKLHLLKEYQERMEMLKEILEVADSRTIPYIQKLIRKEQGQEEL